MTTEYYTIHATKEQLMSYSKSNTSIKCYIAILPLLIHASLSAQPTKNELKKLCDASQNGKLHIARNLLMRNPALLNQQISKKIKRHKFRGTALHYAVGPRSNTNPELVNYLLAQGSNPNKCNNKNNTPLHSAISNKKALNVIISLVYAGANLLYRNNLGQTPLHCALYNGNIPIITLLLANNARLDIPNNKNQTALTQPIDPKTLQRHNTLGGEIARLLASAQHVQAIKDKVSFIATASKNPLTHAQKLAFKILVESGELESLTALYNLLSDSNPKLLSELLQSVSIEVTPKVFKNIHRYYAALYGYWLRTPPKLLYFIAQAKLDKALKPLKLMISQKKIYNPLIIIAICERLKKLTLHEEQQNSKSTDLSFWFA